MEKLILLNLLLYLLQFKTTFSLPDFVARLPNGDAGLREGSGITCEHLGHVDCNPGLSGQPRNPFGMDFDANGRVWNRALCEMDSDRDGVTNGQELGDPCCTWTADNPTPLRQDQLSHPGDATEDGARNAPGCPTDASPSADPPTSPPTSPPTMPSAVATPTGGSETPSTPTPSPTEDEPVCFPGHATVHLKNGLTKRMDQLEIGDRVHIGDGRYSDVFMFTHKVPDVNHEFVTIRAGTEEKLEATVTLTKGHFIYANGNAVTADKVRVGDMLELHDGRTVPVIETECATFKGLYNPQTTHGTIVVDGVKVSTYTTAVQSKIAHSLLAPLRAVYRWFGWSSLSLEEGAPRAAKVLP